MEESKEDRKKAKAKSNICNKFNRHVSQMLIMVGKKMPNDPDIWFMRKRISLLIATSEEDLINRCYPKLYEMRTKILERDETFLTNEEIEKKYIAKYIKKDDNEEYMKDMVRTLRNLYIRGVKEEQELVWSKVSSMLELALEYMLLTGQHI